MTTFSRLALASAAALAFAVASVAGAGVSQAAPSLNVTLAPVQNVAPVGGEGVFRVELDSASDSLPEIQYNISGGQITGLVAPNVTSEGHAEGEVHVERDTPGTVTLTASFGGTVLASGDLRFAQMGALSINVAIDSGPDGAARTWLFEVTNRSGVVVGDFRVGTSGDAPTAAVSTGLLPYGSYGVRQVLGNDTKLACDGGAFYQVTAPVSGATTVELADASLAVNFAIHVCNSTPLNSDIPVDPIAPGAGTVGEAYPGEAPVDEVRGVRQAGEPLPPNTGSGVSAAQTLGWNAAWLVLGMLLLTVPVGAVASAATVRAHRR